MNLKLDTKLGLDYKSTSQKIRAISEGWVLRNVYCPASGKKLSEYKNNKPVADFYCETDHEDFELKAKQNKLGKKINDGAYKTMMERLSDLHNPNLFLLTYDAKQMEVKHFSVVPRHFFTPDVIEKRKPLSSSAQRTGWTGCNILLDKIPRNGFIYYVKNKIVFPKQTVQDLWERSLFLRDDKYRELHGWLLDVMRCIDSLQNDKFTLQEIYQFTDHLQQRHPDNKHVKAKIRQQLQILRDKGYLIFEGDGVYHLT